MRNMHNKVSVFHVIYDYNRDKTYNRDTLVHGNTLIDRLVLFMT